MFDIAIVGLGLMGGSLALALKESSSLRVLGIERDEHTRARVQELAITSEVTAELERVKDAGLIILATPVRTIVELVPRAGEFAQEGALILDLGSTKRAVVQAMNRLPAHVHSVGGHPLTGKETSGIGSADGRLFQNKVFILTPTFRTSEADLGRVRTVLAPIGTRFVEMDAEQHDLWLGLTSHLPYVAATALVLTALDESEANWVELVASGFRDTSRLAASDEVMMSDILLTNHDSVVKWLKRFSSKISMLAEAIERRDMGTLSEQMHRAAEKRRTLK